MQTLIQVKTQFVARHVMAIVSKSYSRYSIILFIPRYVYNSSNIAARPTLNGLRMLAQGRVLSHAPARAVPKVICALGRRDAVRLFFLEDVQLPLLSGPSGGVQKFLFTSPHRISDLRRLDAVRSPGLSLAYSPLV